jgi:branched-chain amino acid transport system permease protein
LDHNPVDLLKQNWRWLAVTAAVAAVPLIADDYALSLLIVGGTYAIMCIGLNLFMGQTGQISFGHNAFAAIGCYGTAILCTNYNWFPPLALVVAGAMAFVLAQIIGKPTLRLKGHYLAMATLALGLIVYELAVQLEWLTLGFLGISGIPPFSIGIWEPKNDVQYYYLVWIFVGIGLWASERITKSRLGRALSAIAGDESAARALGIDVSRYKLKALAISAVYASVGGSLLAHYVSFVSPEIIGLGLVTLLFTMVFVGGIGTTAGPVLGAVVINVLPAMLTGFQGYRQLAYGVMLLVVVMFIPRGLQSLASLRFTLKGSSR